MRRGATMSAELEPKLLSEVRPVLEDSPSFRKAFLMTRSKNKELKRHLSSVHKSLGALSIALASCLPALASVADDLTGLGVHCLGADAFRAAFDALHLQLAALVTQLDSRVLVSLEAHLSQEMKGFKKMRTQAEQDQATYEALLFRVLQMRKDVGAEQLLRAEEELRLKQQELDIQRYDLWFKQTNMAKSSKIVIGDNMLLVIKSFRAVATDLLSALDSQTKDQSAFQASVEALRLEPNNYFAIRQWLMTRDRFSDEENFNTENTRGYLYLKEKNSYSQHTWTRRWCQIKGGELSIQALDGKSNYSVNMLLCTVKDSKEKSRRFCFQVVSNERKYKFQAESGTDLDKWLNGLRACISRQLDQQSAPEAKANQTSAGDEALASLMAIESNKVCAECGEANPTWCSINLAVTVCLDCSGIHRSLGTHITKVRSTTLDTREFSPALVELMTQIGNERAAAVWAASVPDDVHRLTPASARSEKERWIQDKYVKKRFLAPCAADASAHARDLHTGIADRHLRRVYECIVRGADLEWRNAQQNGMTAVLLAASTGQAAILELVLLNGASVDALDNISWNALQYAVASGDEETVRVLLRRGVSVKDATSADAVCAPSIIELAGNNETLVELLVSERQREEAKLRAEQRRASLSVQRRDSQRRETVTVGKEKKRSSVAKSFVKFFSKKKGSNGRAASEYDMGDIDEEFDADALDTLLADEQELYSHNSPPLSPRRAECHVASPPGKASLSPSLSPRSLSSPVCPLEAYRTVGQADGDDNERPLSPRSTVSLPPPTCEAPTEALPAPPVPTSPSALPPPLCTSPLPLSSSSQLEPVSEEFEFDVVKSENDRAQRAQQRHQASESVAASLARAQLARSQAHPRFFFFDQKATEDAELSNVLHSADSLPRPSPRAPLTAVQCFFPGEAPATMASVSAPSAGNSFAPRHRSGTGRTIGPRSPRNAPTSEHSRPPQSSAARLSAARDAYAASKSSSPPAPGVAACNSPRGQAAQSRPGAGRGATPRKVSDITASHPHPPTLSPAAVVGAGPATRGPTGPMATAREASLRGIRAVMVAQAVAADGSATKPMT